MTTTMQSVGIYGVGLYLPTQVRTNDWWPEAIRSKWQERARAFRPDEAQVAELAKLPPGARLVAEAIAASKGDPFYGTRERRAAPPEMMCSEMETAAAREAIARAGVKADDIDLITGSSAITDYILTPNACAVHERLGLRHDCMAISIDNGCSSFLVQLTMVEAMLRAGRGRYALLFQSCAMRLASPENPQSAWFGDGATAVVLGPVREGRGILGSAHRTFGKFHDALVGTTPSGRWWEGGKVEWTAKNKALSREAILSLPDCAKDAVGGALSQAELTPADVNFYACHQATPWYRRLTQEYVGMNHAKALDTYEWAGSLSAANIPLIMGLAERDHMLKDDDVVATFSGGSGMTYSSVVLRWGR